MCVHERTHARTQARAHAHTHARTHPNTHTHTYAYMHARGSTRAPRCALMLYTCTSTCHMHMLHIGAPVWAVGRHLLGCSAKTAERFSAKVFIAAIQSIEIPVFQCKPVATLPDGRMLQQFEKCRHCLRQHVEYQPVQTGAMRRSNETAGQHTGQATTQSRSMLLSKQKLPIYLTPSTMSVLTSPDSAARQRLAKQIVRCSQNDGGRR